MEFLEARDEDIEDTLSPEVPSLAFEVLGTLSLLTKLSQPMDPLAVIPSSEIPIVVKLAMTSTLASPHPFEVIVLFEGDIKVNHENSSFRILQPLVNLEK